MTTSSEKKIPQAFIWRRLHSLTGVWLAFYLIIHLFTNSQAALWFGSDGTGFIHAVNGIHELPYLFLIELSILGVPILIHLLWGIQSLRTSNYNSFGETGNTPYLSEYPRNRAYTWQRITSYVLMIGIIAHVVQMRIIDYPLSTQVGSQHLYTVRITSDEGLYTLAPRLGATIYNQKQIEAIKQKIEEEKNIASQDSTATQLQKQQKNWLEILEKRPLGANEVIAEANNFGTVELLMVRDTFKMPLMIALYTLLVLTACFHAFNGLWTAMITWGITLTPRSQSLMRKVTNGLMFIVAGCGLSAIWLTYWITLKQ